MPLLPAPLHVPSILEKMASPNFQHAAPSVLAAALPPPLPVYTENDSKKNTRVTQKKPR